MVETRIELRTVSLEEAVELGQMGGDGRAIRILYPRMQLDKGIFDFGFGRSHSLELKYLNQRVGSG